MPTAKPWPGGTPSELYELGVQLEAELRPGIALRSARRGQPRGSRFSDGQQSKSRSSPVRDAVAEQLGLSGTTYERIKRVIKIASDDTLPDWAHDVAVKAREGMDSREISVAHAAKIVDALPHHIVRRIKSPQKKTRLALIRELAAEGNTSAQIADIVHLGIDRVQAICRDEGIELPADEVVGRNRARMLNHTRFVAKAVDEIAGAATGLTMFDPAGVDWTDQQDWIDSLRESMKALRVFEKIIKRGNQPRGNIQTAP